MATNSPSDWLLYGANGYTGRRIAAEAVRRGMRPTLAGRDREKIEPLAAELGCPAKVFPLDDPAAVAAQLAGARAVLNCAGPFSATAGPMIEGCLRAGVHYLDITGEIDGIERAAAEDARARQAGAVLLPAVGFDVVPSDCLAAQLARRLPGAARLELAFTFTGTMSRGTARTTLEAIPRGGRVRQGGKIVRVPSAWKIREIPFPGGPQWAMTAPWGDVATAWHSTGIPDIEVYIAAPRGQLRWIRRLRGLAGLFALRPVRWAALRYIERKVRGPSPAEEQAHGAAFWGRASGPGGAAAATLTTPGGYALTVWSALLCLERTLAGAAAPGFHTPSRAFGPDLILEHPQAEFRWIAAP